MGAAQGLPLNKRFKLASLALLPSWECDAACKHCVFTSSPARKGRLPFEVVRRAIHELRECSTLERVTVSGGEAFLDFEYLLEVAALAASGALRFRVVTNCSFATTEEVAVRRLSMLGQIGIETLGISWDQYHEKFISKLQIQNVLRAARQLGISVRITVVVGASSAFADAVSELGDFGFEVPLTQVKCLPVGRAETKLKPDEFMPPGQFDVGRACRSDFDTLSITPTGDIYPCCAVGGFTEGIKLGRFPELPMEEILRRRESELRWAILAAQGPQYFLQRMSEEEKKSLNLATPLHDCVTCHRLFRTPAGVQISNRISQELREQAVRIAREATIDNA